MSSLGAWLVKGNARKALLQIKVLDVDLNCAVSFVLHELCDGLVNLTSEHSLGVGALLVICLAVIVHIPTNNVVSDQSRLLVLRVQEGQVCLIVHGEIMWLPCQLICQLEYLAVDGESPSFG